MKYLAFLFFTVLMSCAHHRVSQRVSELNSQLDPLLGSSEETVVSHLGVPGRVDEIAGLKVYRYYQSYGQRSTASIHAYSNPYGQANAWGQGQTWDTHDTVNVYFKNGTMIKWDGYVQR
jgi:hypothetical protein